MNVILKLHVLCHSVRTTAATVSTLVVSQCPRVNVVVFYTIVFAKETLLALEHCWSEIYWCSAMSSKFKCGAVNLLMAI